MKREVWILAKQEYLSWLLNTRNVAVLIFVVFVRKAVVLPLIYMANKYHTVLNWAESSIAVANSGVSVLLISVILLTVLSGLPRIDNDFYNIVSRVGMKSWCKAQLVFMYLAVVTFWLFVFFSTWVQTAYLSYIEDGWSLVTTQYSGNTAIENLLPLNLYNQMPPLKAFMFTYLLMLLYFIFTMNVLVLGTLYGKKNLTTIGLVILLAVGVAAAAAKVKWMWLFPVSHSILILHCQKYYRAQLFPIWLSVLLLLAFNVFMTILIYRRMVSVDGEILKGN